MTIWLHSAVLAATIAGTAVIGGAGAAYYAGSTDRVESSALANVAAGQKGDRLPLAANVCHIADLAGNVACPGTPHTVTVQTYFGPERLSVLTRVPAPAAD